MKSKKPISNGRKILYFALTMLACLGLGYALGYLLSSETNNDAVTRRVHNLLAVCTHTVAPVSPPIFWAIALLGGGACACLYCAAKKVFGAWDGENEQTIEHAEDLISWCLTVSNFMLIFDYFWLAVWVHIDLSVSATFPGMALALTGFLAVLLLCVVIQYKGVELTKKINPEKKGNVLDRRFHKEWMESCDEWERSVIGQAALAAYRATCTFCCALWVICLFGQMFLGLGLMPAAIVTAVWMCLTLTYTVACRKLEKSVSSRRGK